MQSKPSQRSENEREDERTQSAVLALVLAEHPAHLTARELAREIGEGDDFERAVRDLTAVGLLRREGESVLPTRGALHFDRLES